jgi:hypothetical protein
MTDNLFSKLATDLARTERMRDPVVWCREKLGIELWSKQQAIVRSVQDHKQTAVRSAHGTGKSLLASVLACWWIDTHPLGEAIVITTAPSRNQVHTIIWESMRKFHRIGDLPGDIQLSDNWLIEGQVVGQGRRPADYNPYSFQGIHRKYVLAILDEACGIPKWLWDASISITTSEHCRILAIGNPDDPNSEFKFKFNKDSAWNQLHISIWDSPNFTGEAVTQEAKESLSDNSYVEVAQRDWGVGSGIWQSKIEGEFPTEDESAVIPRTWLYEAVNRHRLYEDIPRDPVIEAETGKIVSVDVAYTGQDKTVIAQYKEPRFTSFEEFKNLSVKEHVHEISIRTDKKLDKIVIDVGGGYGAAIFDLLKEAGFRVIAFNGGAKTSKLDATRTMGFTRVRSAAMWNVRELLNPNGSPTVSFPEIDRVIEDLATPKYEVQLDKVQVESKDKIRERLRRSTDYGDTVMMALWVPKLIHGDFEDAAFSYVSRTDNTELEAAMMSGAFSWNLDDDWRDHIDETGTNFGYGY